MDVKYRINKKLEHSFDQWDRNEYTGIFPEKLAGFSTQAAFNLSSEDFFF